MMKNSALLILFFCLTVSAAFGVPIPKISKLSLEEKIGQLLIVHFHGEEANEDARILIHESYVGGFAYYRWANGLTSLPQVKRLSMTLQNESSIPLFIMIDQEGGAINPLKRGFTLFPGNYAIAKTGKPSWSELSAFFSGQELRHAGINMNLAPVADININPLNPVIGIRSYGNSPEVVVRFAEEALKGFRRAGIASCLKHFPGHGDVSVDSHENLPMIQTPLEELIRIELAPFEALNPQTDLIMTAHLMVPALDTDYCITFSKKAITGFLKNQIGFEGLVMTDSLAMGAILHKCSSIEEAAIQSLEAGHDLILLAGGGTLFGQNKGQEQSVEDVLRVHKALVKAVQSGRISENQVDRSVEKILRLKASLQGIQEIYFDLNDIAEHQKLAQDIASHSVAMIAQNIALPMDYIAKKIAIIAPALVEAEIGMSPLLHVGSDAKALFFEELNPNDEEIQSVFKICDWADIIIICTYNGWINKGQQQLVEALNQFEKPVIALALRDPQDADFLEKCEVAICTYSPVPASIEAALKLIFY